MASETSMSSTLITASYVHIVLQPFANILLLVNHGYTWKTGIPALIPYRNAADGDKRISPLLLHPLSSPLLVNFWLDIISLDSNVDVSDGETEFSADPVPLDHEDRVCVSTAGGIWPLNCSEGTNSLDKPAQLCASLPNRDDLMAENLGVVDVPISVLSNDALIAHLSCNMRIMRLCIENG
ncbi:hypothetical protein M5K25_023579 [Dendrobium thyrsiflorum]|uniref:Uncharacterized protein n=1 Tax=Dendrobium thyrsiflorum TaxID=117978 RepID=A0ABD0UFG3_DENTH